MRIARVIMTFECHRKCSYCSNDYKSIMDTRKPLYTLYTLRPYDVICITGGEPMLYPDKILDFIRRVKKINPGIIIYLYTALWRDELIDILPEIDGLHFTLHANSTKRDIEGFETCQENLRWQWRANQSHRLYINSVMPHAITIVPTVWARLEVKPWQTETETECTLPPGETLFELDQKCWESLGQHKEETR